MNTCLIGSSVSHRLRQWKDILYQEASEYQYRSGAVNSGSQNIDHVAINFGVLCSSLQHAWSTMALLVVLLCELLCDMRARPRRY